MMNTFKLCVGLILLLILSCKQEDNVIIDKDYYTNGIVRNEAQITGEKRNGYYKAYYEDGSLMFITFYKNDSLNGIFSSYDSVTKKNDFVNYFCNGVKVGLETAFHSNGRLSILKDYKLIYDTTSAVMRVNDTELNQELYLDSLGKLRKHSYFYTKKVVNEAVKLSFVGYYGKYKKVYISNFDDSYSLKNKAYDSIYFGNTKNISIPLSLLKKHNATKILVEDIDTITVHLLSKDGKYKDERFPTYHTVQVDVKGLVKE